MPKQLKSSTSKIPHISPDPHFEMQKETVVDNPELIACLIHEKKNIIIKALISSEYTIRELSRETNINPGTVKRHINELEQVGLIKFVRQAKNEYGILLKFYRAISRKFIVKFELE